MSPVVHEVVVDDTVYAYTVTTRLVARPAPLSSSSRSRSRYRCTFVASIAANPVARLRVQLLVAGSQDPPPEVVGDEARAPTHLELHEPAHASAIIRSALEAGWDPRTQTRSFDVGDGRSWLFAPHPR